MTRFKNFGALFTIVSFLKRRGGGWRIWKGNNLGWGEDPTISIQCHWKTLAGQSMKNLHKNFSYQFNAFERFLFDFPKVHFSDLTWCISVPKFWFGRSWLGKKMFCPKLALRLPALSMSWTILVHSVYLWNIQCFWWMKWRLNFVMHCPHLHWAGHNKINQNQI